MKKFISILSVTFIVAFSAFAEIELIDGLTIYAPKPVDARMVFDTTNDMHNLISVYRYEGLLTFVKTNNTFYYLVDGIENSNWQPFVGGTNGGSMTKTQITDLIDDVYVDVVGDTMSGDLNMGNNQIAGLANGNANQDAVAVNQLVGATNAFTASPISQSIITNFIDDVYVDVAGDNMTGSLGLGGNNITNLADGLTDTDAVNYGQAVKFNGERSIKRTSFPNGVNVSTSNVVDFLNAVFFPFVNATISLSVSPTLVEEGTLQDVTCSGSVTANDEIVFSDAYVDPSVGANITFTAQAGAYSVQQTAVSVNTSYRSYITTGNAGAINSPQRSINFVYPYFWGMTATDLTAGGNPLYIALTKAIQNRGNKAVTYDGTSQYIYFAYPAVHGDLTSIKDQSNLEALTSFTKYVVDVTSSGLDTDWTVSYNVYRNNNLTQVNNGTFTFIY